MDKDTAQIQILINGQQVKDNSIISSCSEDCSEGICKDINLPRECVFFHLKNEYLGIYKKFSEVDYPASKSDLQARVILEPAKGNRYLLEMTDSSITIKDRVPVGIYALIGIGVVIMIVWWQLARIRKS